MKYISLSAFYLFHLKDNDDVTLLDSAKAERLRRRVMFTDESAIHLSNRMRRVYFWSPNNFHFYEEIAKHPPHVMMWAAALSAESVVRPFFFERGTITTEIYLDMLQNFSFLSSSDGG